MSVHFLITRLTYTGCQRNVFVVVVVWYRRLQINHHCKSHRGSFEKTLIQPATLPDTIFLAELWWEGRRRMSLLFVPLSSFPTSTIFTTITITDMERPVDSMSYSASNFWRFCEKWRFREFEVWLKPHYVLKTNHKNDVKKYPGVFTFDFSSPGAEFI